MSARDEAALEIGRDVLKDGLVPTLTRLVGVTNAAKLMADTVGLLGPRDEPRIHSGLTDVLPDNHPLRNRHTYCDRDKCRELLHCCINENMQTWVEANRGNYCLPCFAELDADDGSDAWGVPK